MDGVQTVAPVTAPMSLPRALVLVLRLSGLVLLWWLLATTTAHADSGDQREPGVHDLRSLTAPVGQLRPGHAVERVREPVASTARATVERAVRVTGSVTDSPAGQLVAPVVDPVVDPVLEAADSAIVAPTLDAVDPPAPASDQSDQDDQDDSTPTPSRSGVDSRHVRAPAVADSGREALGPLGSTVEGSSLLPATATTAVAGADAGASSTAVPTFPATPDDQRPDGGSATETHNGPGSLARMPTSDVEHGAPVTWIVRQQAHPPLPSPANDPDSTPD